MISGTKIVESFVTYQFVMNSFSYPFRIDQSINWGSRHYIYVREDIPAKLLSTEPIPSEFFFAEFNFLKQKWLVSCSHNLHKNTISKHKRMLSKNLDLCSSQYDNNFILGDSNVGVSDPHTKYFYNLSGVT